MVIDHFLVLLRLRDSGILFLILLSRVQHIFLEQCLLDNCERLDTFIAKSIETFVLTIFATGRLYIRLFIQSSKTEFIIIGSPQQLSKVSTNKLRVGEVTISPVSAVRDLGSWLDIHMSMNIHVSKVCSKAFRSLYHIKQIRKYLTEDSTRILVHAFITSHIDYCNSLLYGIPKYQVKSTAESYKRPCSCCVSST